MSRQYGNPYDVPFGGGGYEHFLYNMDYDIESQLPVALVPECILTGSIGETTIQLRALFDSGGSHTIIRNLGVPTETAHATFNTDGGQIGRAHV